MLFDPTENEASSESAADQFAASQTFGMHAPHHAVGPTTGDSYMQSTVTSASPARLRLLLIERAQQIATTLSDDYRTGAAKGSTEASGRLFDILSELLSGVTGSTDPAESKACDQVADLYVFLIQHLLAAEEIGDSTAVTEIAAVLGVEAETWRLVCANESDSQSRTVSGGAGLNFTA